MASSARKRNRPDPAFAGYLTTKAGTAAIQARLTVPKFTCTRKEQAISPGVFLLDGPADHEYFTAANIILGCYKRRPVTEEALVINNVEKNSVKQLHTGDLIVVRVSDRAGGLITVEVKDVSKGHRFAVKATGEGAAAQAELLGEWASVENSTGKPVVPPRFAPTVFTAGTVDGQALGSLKPTGYDMASSSNGLQISTSRLSGTPRDTFTCTRR
jgi:hypothetical protein